MIVGTHAHPRTTGAPRRFLFLLLLGAWPGCSPFDEVQRRPHEEPGEILPPLRPCGLVEHGSEDDDGLDLVFVARRDIIKPTDDHGGDAGAAGSDSHRPVPGFDLDHRCTAPGEVGACIPPANNVLSGDWPGCVDNSAAGLRSVTNIQDLTNGNHESGLVSSALRVSSFNGTGNDERVVVSFYAVTRSPTGGRADDAVAPTWREGEPWNVLDAYLAADVACATEAPARYRDSAASVHDGVLEAYFEECLASGGLLKGMRVRGRLEHDGKTWQLRDTQLGARRPVSALVFDVLNLQQLTSECPNWEGVKASLPAGLCEEVDVALSGSDDGSEVCDAISFAWWFEGVPAALHRVVPAPALPCEVPDDLESWATCSVP